MKSESLTINEFELFNGVIKWAQRNCEKNGVVPTSTNKRETLGASLMDIRFASMTITEFTQCTIEDNAILTNIEENQVFKFIGSGGKSECKFPSEKRNLFFNILATDTTWTGTFGVPLSNFNYEAGLLALKKPTFSFGISKTNIK